MRRAASKFPIQNLMIGQPESAETVSDPTKSFASRMGNRRRRVRRPNDLGHQLERFVLKVVLFENRVEGYVFAVVPQFAAGHIKDRPTDYRRPPIVGIAARPHGVKSPNPQTMMTSAGDA